MALYSDFHYAIHSEFILGYLAMFVVCLALICALSCYISCLLRPDDLGKDISSLCLWACLSVLLVHSKGGRPGDARVVTSYTSVVLGYVGSFGYDRAPRCDWGRWQVMTALSVRRNSCVAFGVFPDVRVRCRSSCKEVTGLDVLRCGMFSPLSHFPGTCSPNHVLT